MPDVGFARVNALPPVLTPGVLYFIKRPDGLMDVVAAGNDGQPIFSRRPHVDMIVESSPGLLPVDASFGRYIATCPLELLADKCAMIADVAATNQAVLPVFIGVTLIARATFAPGQAQAVVEVLQPAVPAPSILLFRTPAVQDPTLSGVVGTYAARRL